MDPQLGTTNLLLGIMAVASALEAAIVVGLGIVVFVVIRRVTAAVERLESQQVTPALGRVNAILDDVQDVTGTIRKGAGRFEPFVRSMTAALCSFFERRRETSTRRPH
jgi:hypothetical protein